MPALPSSNTTISAMVRTHATQYLDLFPAQRPNSRIIFVTFFHPATWFLRTEGALEASHSATFSTIPRRSLWATENLCSTYRWITMVWFSIISMYVLYYSYLISKLLLIASLPINNVIYQWPGYDEWVYTSFLTTEPGSLLGHRRARPSTKRQLAISLAAAIQLFHEVRTFS